MPELTDLVRSERQAFIELLESLTEDQWRTRSLCAAWTVENVAAHVAWAPVAGVREMAPAAIRAGFRINQMSADAALRWSSRGRPAILDQLRRNIQNDAKPWGVPPLPRSPTPSCTGSTCAFHSACAATSIRRPSRSSPTGPSTPGGR